MSRICDINILPPNVRARSSVALCLAPEPKASSSNPTKPKQFPKLGPLTNISTDSSSNPTPPNQFPSSNSTPKRPTEAVNGGAQHLKQWMEVVRTNAPLETKHSKKTKKTHNFGG